MINQTSLAEKQAQLGWLKIHSTEESNRQLAIANWQLFKRRSTEEVLPQVNHRIMQRLAGIAGLEGELA